MKNTVKVAVCGIISALATVIMLLTNFPLFLYAVPCLAGILFIVPAIEFGTKWGFLSFFVTAVLSLILPTEKEALVVFIGFFGFYPLLKMLIERIGKRAVEFLLKFLSFNVFIILSYFVIIKIIGINPFDTEILGFDIKYIEIIFLIIGNFVFWVLDYAITKVIVLYFLRFRSYIKKFLGNK